MSFSDLLTPRQDVLSDDGIEGIIDLANAGVVRRRRTPLESRPNDFFNLTYPTADVRRVVEKLGTRFLNGNDVPGLFLFEGLKGSGKSHLLLLVYHLFANHTAAQSWLFRHNLICPLPSDAVVIINKFTDQPLKSIWDFIFEQLTGKRPEKTTVQPGLGDVEAVLGDRRLVLIFDELEQGINVIGDPVLRAQNIAFLQMLSEWGNRSRQVTLFASIYSDRDEPGSTLKRVPAVRVQFTHSTDRARVVLHRLFNNYLDFDMERSAPVIESYLARWQRHMSLDVERLRAEMMQAYPFSPDLLDVLLQRVPARGGFQNLRGALGFFAQLVRFNYGITDLITPAHALIADQVIATLLSDLDASGDLINRARGNLKELERLPLAGDVASAVLLYTLAGTGRVGSTREELLRSVLRPGVDINEIEQTLLAFQKYASHFHMQEGRYFFDVEENADAKVEFRSLSVDDRDAHSKLSEIWRNDIFRGDPHTAIFTDADETKAECEKLEKGRLRYVLAPRRLKAEERHSLYHGMSERNQAILLEPRDAAFNLHAHPDLLKWAKRHIAAQGLRANTPDATRSSHYERIGKEDRKSIVEAIRRAGLIYIRFESFGTTPAADLVEEESLGSAVDKDGVLAALNQSHFPVQLIEEHLSARLADLKGRTVAEVDREYRNTLGFPVPTLQSSVSRAIRALCKGEKIGVRHTRGNYCHEDPPLSETELLAATIDDPFPVGAEPIVKTQQPRSVVHIPDSVNGDLPVTLLPEMPPFDPPAERRETLSIPPQLSAGALRQEMAARLQNYGEAKILRIQFTVFLEQTAGDLSALPASLRGGLAGQGTLAAEITLTKEGEFSKGQIEQMAESLPSISGAEYRARLDVLVGQPQVVGVMNG
jgi:hypothetical protein